MNIYNRDDCVVFYRVKEAFGGLSNMAPGYPLTVNGISIRTSEALYQACRFPALPDLQKTIIDQASPMAAKMVTKPHRDQTRSDWDSVRMDIMAWCLMVKLIQNRDTFGPLLQSTSGKQIVEQSSKDDFWGAIPQKDGTLIGQNVLGDLLTAMVAVVEVWSAGAAIDQLSPLDIPDFNLYGKPIETIIAK